MMKSAGRVAARSLAIPAAAKALRVSEKTVRNYIVRGVLQATKWNGAWRIPLDSVQEVHWTKYGEAAMLPAPAVDTGSALEAGQESGMPAGADIVRVGNGNGEGPARTREVVGFSEEERRLHERIERLEASAASGWTESRQYKEQVRELRLDLGEARTDARSCQEATGRMQLEVDRLRSELGWKDATLTEKERELVECRAAMEEQKVELEETKRVLQATRARVVKG
jgi:hypothetical protein